METIGEHLKRVRKTCGYSLEDVAQVTKINPRYLDAIENDEFAKIPGETFLQGFLRSYARFLGINEKEIVGRLKESKRLETPSGELHNPAEEVKDGRKTISITPERLKIILPFGAGLVALLVIVILFAGGRETTSIQSSKAAEEVKEVSATRQMPEVKEMSAEPADTQPAQAAQPGQAMQSAAAPLSLRLKAKELTWLQVEIDGKGIREALLRPGEEVLYSGERKIGMTLGNAGGVDAVINGKTQEPFGKSGEVVRGIMITKAGVTKGAAGGKEPSDILPGASTPLMNPPP